MIKLELSEIEEVPKTTMEFYDSINRIPLSVVVGNYHSHPPTKYCRYLKAQNFIEFRFDKNNNTLFEITAVTINPDSIRPLENDVPAGIEVSGSYKSSIIEDASDANNEGDVHVFRGSDKIIFTFDGKEPGGRYLAIGENVFLSVDSESYLKSLLVTGLMPEQIKDILGTA